MINEQYIINLDRGNSLLEMQGVSFGRQFQHRGFYMSVAGCETQEGADDYVIKEMQRRGWAFREKWWQFWSPKDFR